MKNERIKVTSAVGANKPAEPAPSQSERNLPPKRFMDGVAGSTETVVAQDETRCVGSCES